MVGLIAATRRLLVLTAEFSELFSKGQEAFRNGMLRRQAPHAVADKA